VLKTNVKVLLALLVVTLFIQIPTAFGAEGGYFNNRQINGSTTLTDGKTSTYIDLRYNSPTFEFDKPEDVVKIYRAYQQGMSGSVNACFVFYDENKKQIKEISALADGGWMDVDVKGVQSIKIRKCDMYGYSVYVSEIDFLVQSQLVYEPISKVDWTVTHNQINLSWTKPKDAIATHVYVNGQKVEETTNSSYVMSNLKSDTKYSIELLAVYKFGVAPSYKADIKTSAIPILSAKDFKVVDITHNSATVVFKSKGLNSVPDYIYVYDSKGGHIGQVKVRTDIDTSYTISGLKPETDYVYQLNGKFGNTFTDKETVKFTTLEGDKEVSNLSATATAQDVDLNWKMPDYKSLKVARIYRQKDDDGLIARFFRSASTYEPIFETNGTTFKDLTVKPNTEYKYKITTVDKSGNETDGKTITIRTKKLSVNGGGTEKDENGDYVITWTSPTNGKIKVLVGGEQFAIVPASDKKITIPKDKMKFDLIGLPDVQLIPIDEDGNEGVPSKPGGSGTGGGIGDVVGGEAIGKIINPENLLVVVMALLLLIGGFILLALAFELVPKFVKMIRNAFKSNRKDVNVYTRRRIEE